VKHLDHILGRLPSWVLFIVCLVLTALIGVIDDLTGPETTMTLFYVAPIAIAGWYGSRGMGLTIAVVATTVLMAAEIAGGRHYSHLYLEVWNNLARFGLLLLISYLVTSLRKRFEVEKILADTDPLTTAYNSRAFQERASIEILRLERYRRPFTIAYFDIDDFKKVNDIHGHIVGDELLKKTVSAIRACVRELDVVSRLGGDEFAVLFVDTPLLGAAEAIGKINAHLKAITQEMRLSATFSIGMVTYEAPPSDVRHMLRLADEAMYTVKRQGKNQVMHVRWRGEDKSFESEDTAHTGHG
jgi:diguanylate cyclase (GGDEF)-like protein